MSVRFDYGGMTYDLATLDQQVLRACEGIHQFKRGLLARVPDANEHGRYLWSVTVSFPETARGEYLFALMHLFAEWIGNREHEGALFCAHTRERTQKPPYGLHFSGLVMGSRRPERMRSAWVFRSASSPSATCIHLVGGQDIRSTRIANYKCPNLHVRTKKGGIWMDVADACAGKTLRENLTTVVTYAMKPDLRLDEYPLRDRIVASGTLGRLWRKTTRWPLAGPGFNPFAHRRDEISSSGELRVSQRPCPDCGKLLPPGSLAARCGPCRSRKFREDRKASSVEDATTAPESERPPEFASVEADPRSDESVPGSV